MTAIRLWRDGHAAAHAGGVAKEQWRKEWCGWAVPTHPNVMVLVFVSIPIMVLVLLLATVPGLWAARFEDTERRQRERHLRAIEGTPTQGLPRAA